MRFLFVLLVVGGLVCGWFVLRDKRAEMNLSNWGKQLATYIQPLVGGKLKPDAPWEADEASFFKLLYFLHRVENKGENLNLDATVKQALEQLQISGDKAEVTKACLLENYEMAKKLRIFEDTSNLIKLDQGEPALVMLKGWEEEPIGLRQIVPPSEAPEIANAIPNFVLLPASVRDLQSGLPASESPERVRDLARGGFITKGAVDRLLGAAKRAP